MAARIVFVFFFLRASPGGGVSAGGRHWQLLRAGAPDAMKGTPPMKRNGWLVMDGWAGRNEQPVTIEGETRTRYRVRAVEEQLRLPSRGLGVRIILRSGTVLVPKTAVRLERTP